MSIAGLPEMEDLIVGALDRYVPEWKSKPFITPRSKFVALPETDAP